jgi:hypothetical protein
MRRRSLFAALAAMLLLALALLQHPGAQAQTSGADFDLPNGAGHFYTQTNGGAGSQFGYRITNDGGINFWSEFQRLGGVNALGYPVSQRFLLDGFTVQATQKVIMQWRPDVHQVYFINVFDKLHDMGKDGVLQATYQIPPQLDPSFDVGKTGFSQISQARLTLLNADLTIAARYYNGQSQAAAILYDGLPTSRIANEGPFSAIRAQRIAIQHWNVANPAAGIKAGDVTVVNGGDIAKSLGLVPLTATYTETSAGVSNAPTPTATATPAATAPPAATAAPTAAPRPAFPYASKEVTTPPQDCGSSVPCVASAPNLGQQYITGHVLDASGNGLSGVMVRMTYYGNTTTVQTAYDGKFTLVLATTCPKSPLTFNVFLVDSSGNPISDTRTVNYTDCTVAGEFHFDFVKTS